MIFPQTIAVDSTPSWTSSGDDQAGARFGISVASAGDVNGDGYSDVILSAKNYDTANIDAGKAYLYLGNSSGLQSSISWTSSGDAQAHAYFGVSVASAGDVNGDGYSDVIIGASGYDTSNFSAGKAYLYLGNSSGLRASPSWASSGDDQLGAHFGISVGSAGDVNGDGYSDVIIGAYGYNTVNTDAGKAYLYLGNSSGLQASPSWASSGDDQLGAHFGGSVASAGDVNSDGYCDVIIGAYGYNSFGGKAYLYLGNSSGLQASPSWTSSGDDQAGARFGISVGSAGDVNGDGYSDVIIGASGYSTTNTNAGKAYLYLGSSSGLQASSSWTSSGDDQANSYFSSSVASADDVNGDGYNDVIIGAPFLDTANTEAGKVYLYLGSSSGLQASPSWINNGDDQAGAFFGEPVASAGDVNGDGYSDVIIGASGYDTSNNDAGKAYMYLGINTTPPTITDKKVLPDPQETYGYVNISANVSDDVNVETVLIVITDPNDEIVGNFTMSYDSINNRYYKNQTYDIIGIYQFIIWANDTSNNWNFSSGQFTIQDTTPPTTPTALIVIDVPSDEGGTLNITWNLNSGDTVIYSLYSNKSGSWQFLVNVTHPQNWYVDMGLTNNVRYYYKISAWDEVPNESPLSDAFYGIPIDNLPPTTPTGLAVISPRSGDLNITWNLNTDDTQTFSIYSNKTGTWALLANVTHPQNWYVDTGLTSGRTYYYRISAWDEAPLESSISEEVYGVSFPIGTIAGIVKDKDDNPIEGATVRIYGDGTTTNPSTSTTTNSIGVYSVDVSTGTYDVKIEKSGYDSQWKKDLVVIADQTTITDITLLLKVDVLSDYWLLIILIVVIIVLIIMVILTAKKKKPFEETKRVEEEIKKSEIEEKTEVEEEKPR
jgi:fibronectin type 3 domain-containing protein